MSGWCKYGSIPQSDTPPPVSPTATKILRMSNDIDVLSITAACASDTDTGTTMHFDS